MKIYINGSSGYEWHEDKVQQALERGWTDSGGKIEDLTIVRSIDSLPNCMEAAKNNGAQFVHRSYGGASSNIALAESYYPDVILSMPPGSNSKMKAFNKPIPQKLLVISSGDNGVNETAWNTEFVENDPITAETVPDELDTESFASSYGLGKIAYIMHALNCTATEARIRARITGSENGVWHERNGYGEINVQRAIAYQAPVSRRQIKHVIIKQ